MTVTLQDGSAGLFDVLGRIFHAMSVTVTAAGTTVRDEIEDIVTQFENVADDIDLTAIIAGVKDADSAMIGGADGTLSTLKTVAREYLIEVFDQDAALASKNITTALETLIEQMENDSDSVDASAVGVTAAASGSPDGNGLVVATEKRGDGLVQEHAIAETITVEAANDVGTALTISQGAALDAFDVDWPGTSGASATLAVTSPSTSLISEGGFDKKTTEGDLPRGFICSVGSPGVDVKFTSPEVQTVEVSGTPTGGYYLLHYVNSDSKTQTTDPIAYNANASAVQSALRKLDGLGSVTVTATGTDPNYTHTITFLGAGGNVTQLTSTNRMTGASGTNEVQVLSLTNAEGGTFTITWDFGSGDETTGAIAYNATAATVQTAIEALTTPVSGDVVCTGGDLPDTDITISFAGNLEKTNIENGTVDAGSLTGSTPSITITEAVKGVPAQNEIQTLTLYGASGGTFTLSLDGKESGTIAYNASNATLDTAIEAIDGVDTTTIGSGPLPAATTIEFTGSLANSAVNLMGVDVTSLTSSMSASMAETTPGTAGTNEIQFLTWNAPLTAEEFTIDKTGTVSGGTFDLTVNGDQVTNIAYNATAYEIAKAWNDAHASAENDALMTYSPDSTTSGTGQTAFYFLSANAADVTDATVDSTNLTGGGSYAANKVQDGNNGGVSNLSGNFKLKLPGSEYSAAISWDTMTPSTVQAALEGISAIGSGNVTVTGIVTSPLNKVFAIEFVNDLAETNMGTFSVGEQSFPTGDAIITVQQNGGSGGTSEVQTLTVAGTPTQGTIDLTYGGETVTIDYNDAAADVQTQLRTITGLSAVTCGGGPLPGTPVTITFPSSLGDVSLIDVDDDKLKYSIAETQTGSAGIDEQQTITLGNTEGGTFTLTHSASTTSAIDWDATAAAVEAALDALGIATFSVTGSDGGPWTATFSGALAAQDVADFTYSTASLTGSTASGAITTTTQGSSTSGAITHDTTTSGDTQVYAGSYAIYFESDASTLTQLDYKLTTLQPETAYAANCFITVNTAAASGVIQLSLVDGISGTVINDEQGNANTLTVNCTDLTTSFQALADVLASGDPIFRTPKKMPDLVFLRVRFSTAPPSTRKVYFDELSLVQMTELYPGGPLAAAFAGNQQFRIDDAWTITVTNDRAGLLHEWMQRTFDLAGLGLLLPSDSGGSETIPDTVVS